MPIKKENLSLYPVNWRKIAASVKEAANWTCQGCDRPCRRPGESWDELKYRLAKKSKTLYLECCEKPNRFTLTVAHLNHTPSDISLNNLKSLCAPCHLQYDSKHHAANAAKTRAKKKDESKSVPNKSGRKPRSKRVHKGCDSSSKRR